MLGVNAFSWQRGQAKYGGKNVETTGDEGMLEVLSSRCLRRCKFESRLQAKVYKFIYKSIALRAHWPWIDRQALVTGASSGPVSPGDAKAAAMVPY